MNDNSSKRAASAEVKNESEEQKKFRGTFFGADLEKVATELMREVFAQTHEPFQNVCRDHAEFLRSLKEIKNNYKKLSYKPHEEKHELVFKMDEEEPLKKVELFSKNIEEKLSVYLKKIPYFIAFSDILKKVTPQCEYIDVNILQPFRKALSAIREAFGCDLANADTWGVARPYTDKLCELANAFEDRKTELYEKRDNFLTQNSVIHYYLPRC